MKALVLVAASLVSGCGLIGFDVTQSIPEQTVPGSTLGALLPSFLPAPFPINIDVKQQEQAHNTGPASSANLKSLTFAATPHAMPCGNFDFVDEIHVFMPLSRSALPMVEIANSPRDQGSNDTNLTVLPNIDLLPYINAGATISAQASGHSPTQDFTYDGSVVITIRI